MAQSRQHRFSSVIHVRHLLCTIFVSKTACQNYFFQILSQKNAQIVNLKNPDVDLIRRIHPECGFYGFMIRFWICPQKCKIRFWIPNSGFGFSQKKLTLNQQESNFARAAYFFVHFFAVFLHDYNVKRPETSYLSYNFNGENVLRVLFHFFSLPLFFTLDLLGGRQYFSFCHRRYKILMLFFHQKNVPFLFYLSLYISIAFFLIELRWPATYFLFFSVFLLRYIRNFVDMTINLSLILQTTRIQKQFPLSVFVYIDSLIVSALQDAGGYTIFLRNNLELIFGCYTC